MSKALLKISLFAIVMISITLQSCLREEVDPPKGMEQIQQEQGVPVTVTNVNEGSFNSGLTYTATLKGIKESIETAKVGDKIAKINVNVGSVVKQGDVIIEFPENNPALQFEQAKAGLEITKKTFKRMEELLKAGEISQQQYDQVETEYIVAQRNFEQLNQILNVQAPINGTIISIPFREGDVPKIGDVLFTVSQMGRMITNVHVTDKEMQFIRKGMSAIIEWNGKIYKGRVSMIDLAMDPMKKAFPVEIEISNERNELKSGMQVNVSIQTSSVENAIVIPKHLVKTEGDNSYVFVANNETAQLRKVEIGESAGNDIIIKSGLQIGEKLINCCMNKLKDGVKIKVTNEGEI